MVAMLHEILNTNPLDCGLIATYQQLAWDSADPIEGATREEDELLVDLATDLDYFVPDEKMRAEDPSYFGEEQARKTIVAVLDAIAEESRQPPTSAGGG